MGKGIDLAREADLQSGGSGIHADLIDNMKDQLIIVLLNRLKDKKGEVVVPIAEVDATGSTLVEMAIDYDNRNFRFVVRKKS